MAMLDINCSCQTAHIFGDVVAEDDGAHGRLSRATLAHEKDLSLLLAEIHDGGDWDRVCESQRPVLECRRGMTEV